jgi:hemerythrin
MFMDNDPSDHKNFSTKTNRAACRHGGISTNERLVESILYGHELLAEFHSEIQAFCPIAKDDCPEGGGDGANCRPRANVILVRLLSFAIEHIRNEETLIQLHQCDSVHGRALSEHSIAHDMIINDLSAFVMECKRAKVSDVVHAVLSMLDHWFQGHFLTHDKLLLEIASAARPTTNNCDCR